MLSKHTGVTLDPMPIVIGMMGYADRILREHVHHAEPVQPGALGTRYRGAREGRNDREVAHMVRAAHAPLKIADKILGKTEDVWRISRESDLVHLVVLPKPMPDPAPRVYIMLSPEHCRGIVMAIRDAAVGAQAGADGIDALMVLHDSIVGAGTDFHIFGFDPFG
jgi:hypothetical protein